MVHCKIFAEGFRDKIFDIEIVTALGCALSDENSELRSSAFNFFTVAIAQGVLHCFDGIFILKYSQRDFGTRYLILTSSPHLDSALH